MAFEFIKNFYRRVKSMFSSNYIRSISEIAQNENLPSSKMMDAIQLWDGMYTDNAPWLTDDTPTLGLPAIIAGEVARAVTLEMKMVISGSSMGDYISEQFKKVLDNIRPNTEYACAGGGIVFKPYIYDDKIITEIVHADSFYPVAFNSAQEITSAYFLYRHWKGKEIYTRLEKHEHVGTNYTITNKAYVSITEDAIGSECPLSSVESWSDIQPEVKLENVESPLFAYFKIPIGNTIDKKSPLGVSVYSRAVKLIREADRQLNRYLWEYEGGELAVDASIDAFKSVNGQPQLPEGKERLFRTNELDAATTHGDNLMKAWAPTLRDGSFKDGLNRILLQIEDECSLSRGTLADPTVVARTAQEIKTMKQRSYALVSDIQKSLQSALEKLAYAMYCLAVLYELNPVGEYTTQFTWDDSIIIDAETERVRDMQEVSQGLMQKYEYRIKWYGEDELTAKKMSGYFDDLSDDDLLDFGKETDVDEGSNKKSDKKDKKTEKEPVEE